MAESSFSESFDVPLSLAANAPPSAIPPGGGGEGEARGWTAGGSSGRDFSERAELPNRTEVASGHDTASRSNPARSSASSSSRCSRSPSLRCCARGRLRRRARPSAGSARRSSSRSPSPRPSRWCSGSASAATTRPRWLAILIVFVVVLRRPRLPRPQRDPADGRRGRGGRQGGTGLRQGPRGDGRTTAAPSRTSTPSTT